MTNLEKWRHFTKDFCSPASFIDWGFYGLISSALQRRVYYGQEQMRLYFPLFIVLVGPPGVGKGLVIRQLLKVFRHPKMLFKPGVAKEEEALQALLSETAGAKPDTIRNMVIPIAPNATTYESLCQTLSQSVRGILVDDGKGGKKSEMQSAICFTLDELGSLIRKHTEDINTFLCECFDCGDMYEYKTKNQGKDIVRKPCINMIAATNPDFLRRVFSSDLLTGGFASRTFFVYEEKNRKDMYDSPVFDEEQLKCFEDIVDHVKKLAKLQGAIKMSPEALEYGKHWFEVELKHKRPNNHPRLDHYYSRANIHHRKLAAILHFMEKADLSDITLEESQLASKILAGAEKKMHHALTFDAKNPYAEVSQNVYKYIYSNGGASKRELICLFYEILPSGNHIDDMDKILSYLLEAEKIEKDPIKPNHYIPKKV